MKAIVCTRYGPPEVLQIREVPRPAPKKGQVCIRIHATAVTASDCIVRSLRLSPMRKADLAVLDDVLDQVANATRRILEQGPGPAMNEFNRRDKNGAAEE